MSGLIERRPAVAALLRDRGDLLLVTGLGSTTYDAFAAGDDDRNFYLWGAMGAATMTGLGIALAQPDRPVMVLTGDGELLMGLGSLATIAQHAPPNLSIVVLDNEQYSETGQQTSATGSGTDLVAVAAGCGITDTRLITREDEVPALRDAIHTLAATTLAVIKISNTPQPRAIPIRDGVMLKNRFRHALFGVGA
ncbi:MAG: thiamine pyrophosphate-dependent enzyme [Pseudomonadota bacterium]